MAQEQQYVVDEETAEQEFERFAEAMDLHFDERGMDDEDRKGFRESKSRFLLAVRKGSLVVNDSGEPVYKLSGSGRELTFHEPTGATLVSADQRKAGHDVAKMFTMIAEITRTPPETFAKLPNRDIRIIQSVALLLLA